ncbi:AAA family ATPase [Polaribacter undariae]|uniref:AAA family ATPase n=1 Tax=Polaribacter sejongensis TaxID=985043 RepID=A0AAJ1QXT2_9FLAO|nr:UvrD-helicase domain-containing protein [Polaribacter undariae]MDN3620196.1 AAA family ATPase [Polaribacter undariae]UWD32597.1 AAA family ATPase [Polaribacter undariae]
MLNYLDFVTRQKSLLIAPAGYGKTHAISESLKITNGKQLILTHTHAGVSSIKEKLKKAKISPRDFNVETITSFAQKYVLAFYVKKDEIPKQEDSKVYYPFIIKEACKLIPLKPISAVISSTYEGLFVDEYQDCTIEQHKLILSLSKLLPTRILGDQLQGIFDFNNGDLVDFKSESMRGFNSNQFTLNTPWRWYNNNRKDLGDDLKLVRDKIIAEETIDLRNYKSIETHIINEKDLYNQGNPYVSKIWSILKNDKPLFIYPESTSINPRLSIIKKFRNNFSLIESIDHKDFYSFSKIIDNTDNKNIVNVIIVIAQKVFKKTDINNWFNDKGVKSKQKQEDKLLIESLKINFEKLKKEKSLLVISDSFLRIKDELKITCYRKDLFNSIKEALEDAHFNNITVYEAMVNRRNLIRRMGKKIYGNCIGTTLLTKGLEFDTVVLLNAHKYKCPKHLYVAMTRASKKLIIFTINPILNPY